MTSSDTTADLAKNHEAIEQALDIASKNGEALARYFKFKHLPDGLRTISAMYAELAVATLTTVPRNAERTAGLRKLLESKDCAVRAALPE